MNALHHLEKQGLKKFLSYTPKYLLNEPVAEFLTNLEEDKKTGEVFTTFFYMENEKWIDHKVNVRILARETFQIPHEGKSLNDIPATTVQEVLERAMIKPTEEKPLKLSSLSKHYKVLVYIIHQCFIGILSSRDQVFGDQNKMLAVMVSDDS